MRRIVSSAGFTLVELLLVSAIMGLVVAGMYGISLSMNKNTYKQEEIVEIQQNLRVAMGQIARDIRMAGFLIPLDDSPLEVADDNTLTINNSTVSGRMAQVGVGFNSNVDPKPITVSTAEMVDLFKNGDWVRIIRPADREEPWPNVLTVSGKNRSGPTLELSGFDPSDPRTFSKGDVIVRVSSATAVNPATIVYQLTGGELQRNGQVVASYFVSPGGIVFQYLRADGTVMTTPVTGADRNDIRAVRVTMTAATDPVKTAMTDGVQTRTLTQVVRIRNQR